MIEQLESELQATDPERQATSLEQVVDLLRRLGDLSLEELRRRSQGDLDAWLDWLCKERRVVEMRIGGQARFVVVEDAALYRDAFGAMPPKGLPTSLLDFVERPLEQVFGRFARTHGPFTAATLAHRYGMTGAQVQPTLQQLVARSKLLEGGFLPTGSTREYCDPEVLRKLRRRTLAKLRRQVAPVEASALARFLQDWHSLGGGARLEEAVRALEGLPLSFHDLEKAVLPARVTDYRPHKLDQLGQMGMLVWVGCGALGARDGKVALFRRDRISTLLPTPKVPADLDPIQQAILATLSQRGACFFYDLLQACQQKEGPLLTCLWDLVWMGLVSNDSFEPLRHLGQQKGRRRRSLASASGRWFLVSSLIYGTVSDTERLMGWAQTLMERYGVVSREAAASEGIPGGFTPLYQTFKALEESGRVRRGYFVEGLSGAQFAGSATVDRLRNDPDGSLVKEPVLLSTPDPANPYGALLPWPRCGGRPRRASGTTVVLVDGHPVLYLEKGAKKLLSFPKSDEPEFLQAALQGLHRLAKSRRGKMLQVLEIDGQPAQKSAIYPALKAFGFRDDYQGITFLAEP